ncbi:MAG TPA: peptidase S8 [Pseudonocardiaceae bacterium]|jgi:subtilase family serine protease|nr:peptidase S8 [Pseudonocardiaceae bacterium]
MGQLLLRRRLGWLAVTAVAAATALSVVAAPAQAAQPRTATPHAPVAGLVMGFGCAKATTAGAAHCLGEMRATRTRKGGLAPLVMSGPTGYGAPDLQSAYKVGGLTSGGRTVAIVDAFDDPTAEADLGVYRKQYALPACTTANGCFKKVNGNGQTSPLPTADAGWAEEESLDLDMVSSICPDCHILLVEAAGADSASLDAAEDSAAAAGAASISNSWGGSEDSTITSDDPHFNHPGVAITASSGDSGYGVSWPASSPYVTAVGGTSLSKASNSRGWTETAWSGAGSGCSAYEAKPGWQHDSGCAKRTVADVSAVADPNTGVAVYDTYNTCGTSSFCDILIELGLVAGADGWVQVGGTSASSPIIASVYALAGNSGSVSYGSYPYSHTSALFDVTSGSNGSCGGSYLCTAGTGYDGPTGLGTPNGTGAF